MNTSISTRQKIGTLIKKFLRYLDDNKNIIFNVGNLANQGHNIFKDIKKSLDMIFYFEGLGILLRITSDHIIYLGFKGMTRKLYQYENDIPLCRPPKSPDQIIYQGKPTNIRLQNFASNIIGKVFFTLVYKKDNLSKSAVEEMVQAFVSQQKQLNNIKNFVPDIITILHNLNLVEKNQTAESLSYIGPDLKIYDQNNRKISWKILDMMRKQELALGKQISSTNREINNQLSLQNQPQQNTKPSVSSNNPTISKNQNQSLNQNTKHVYPNPYHISYFPQLSYAVLRASNWQKFINKTIFFIGRKQKSENKSRQYQVDLQLNHQAVSRQHAVILYNFEASRWQIRCLSRKNMIKVDDQRYSFDDHNIWLRNKSQIHIGPQKIVFVQAMKMPQLTS